MSVRKKVGGSSAGGSGAGGSGGDEGSTHPIQQGIEKLYAAGKTPRIQVDARRNDVIVPEHVRERWKASLVIDLDPTYPLNLRYEESGLQCDLAFAGHVSRCTFSWQSVYGLFDRATGQGVEVTVHLPRAELPESLRASAPPSKLRALSPVRGAPPENTGAKTEAADSAPDASDELAKARRAKFRVITGG